jgi:hypothetical protein
MTTTEDQERLADLDEAIKEAWRVVHECESALDDANYELQELLDIRSTWPK